MDSAAGGLGTDRQRGEAQQIDHAVDRRLIAAEALADPQLSMTAQRDPGIEVEALRAAGVAARIQRAEGRDGEQDGAKLRQTSGRRPLRWSSRGLGSRSSLDPSVRGVQGRADALRPVVEDACDRLPARLVVTRVAGALGERGRETCVGDGVAELDLDRHPLHAQPGPVQGDPVHREGVAVAQVLATLIL